MLITKGRKHSNASLAPRSYDNVGIGRVMPEMATWCEWIMGRDETFLSPDSLVRGKGVVLAMGYGIVVMNRGFAVVAQSLCYAVAEGEREGTGCKLRRRPAAPHKV